MSLTRTSGLFSSCCQQMRARWPARGSWAWLGWDAERYARACVRLEERGYVQGGQGGAETVYRDLTLVSPEFRPACGRPGSCVTVR